MEIKLSLEDIWTGSDWGGSVGEIIREELSAAIKCEIRKSLKEDKEFKKLIHEFKNKAVEQALASLK